MVADSNKALIKDKESNVLEVLKKLFQDALDIISKGEPAASEAAADDEVGGAGGEVTELLEVLNGIVDQDKAARLKNYLDTLLQAGPAAGPDVTDEELPASEEEKKVADEDLPVAEEKSEAAAVGEATDEEVKEEEKQVLVTDAKKFEQRIVKRMMAKFKAMTDATNLVRPLVGNLNTMSFDSASAIYKFALSKQGVKTTTNDEAALRDLVAMHSKYSRSKGANDKAGVSRSTSADVNREVLSKLNKINFSTWN
jgi:hypothetical protein